MEVAPRRIGHGPIGRGVGEPAHEGVVGELATSERTDDVGQAGAEVDVAEQPAAVVTRGGVGDGALGQNDVRLRQSGQEAGQHQQGQVLHRQRGGDPDIEDRRARERGDQNGPTSVPIRQCAEDRRPEELAEWVERQAARRGRGCARSSSKWPATCRCRCAGSSA